MITWSTFTFDLLRRKPPSAPGQRPALPREPPCTPPRYRLVKSLRSLSASSGVITRNTRQATRLCRISLLSSVRISIPKSTTSSLCSSNGSDSCDSGERRVPLIKVPFEDLISLMYTFSFSYHTSACARERTLLSK